MFRLVKLKFYGNDRSCHSYVQVRVFINGAQSAISDQSVYLFIIPSFRYNMVTIYTSRALYHVVVLFGHLYNNGFCLLNPSNN
jgi:hypothetical protein